MIKKAKEKGLNWTMPRLKKVTKTQKINLGTFGEGKSKIKFSWKESYQKIYSVTFKVKTRADIARILFEFRRAQANLRQHTRGERIKNHSASRDLSFEYIASKNPQCVFRTYRKKTRSEFYKKEYEFNWRILGYVTLQQMQRLIKRKDAII